MTLFRPHRGSLADSMAEVIEVADRAALVSHLAGGVFPSLLLKIEPYYGYDERIGWHTYIVIDRLADGTACVAGFTNGPLCD